MTDLHVRKLVNDALPNLEAKARRVARKAGYIARKSRRTGGFAIIDPEYNGAAFGWDWDLTPVEVIEWCEGGGEL
jgi:hypothetical protein